MTQEIGYGVVVARKFTNDASVSFQLNFAVGASPETINAELDKIAAVLERQQDRIDVHALNYQLEVQRDNLRKQGEMIAELEEKVAAKPDPRLRQGNVVGLQNQLDTARTTYKGTQEGIERAQKHLEQMKNKAA